VTRIHASDDTRASQAEAGTAGDHKPALHLHQEMQTSWHNRTINFIKSQQGLFSYCEEEKKRV